MKQKGLTDEELEKVFELLDYEEHHGIFCTQLFNKIRPMAEELKERRWFDTNSLGIDEQLQLIKEKCPDIWKIINDNWGSIFGNPLVNSRR